MDRETTEMALNGTLVCKLMCALNLPQVDAVGLIDKLIPVRYPHIIQSLSVFSLRSGLLIVLKSLALLLGLAMV